MATDSARESRSQAPSALSQFWQVPIFFLGLISLSAAVFWCPLWRNSQALPLETEPATSDAVAPAADGYLSRAQAYLDAPTPDLEKALETIREFLAQPTTEEAKLAPARLLQGEILIRMQRPEEARGVLARIGEGAPAPVKARARLLLAETCQQLGDWAAAAELWEAALADTRQPPPQAGAIQFALGRCYFELERPEQAAAAWKAALACGGEEEQAAALLLGPLLLEGKEPAAALPYFERALRGVDGAEGYRNRLVPLTEAQRSVRTASLRYRENQDYPRALAVLELFARIAPRSEVEALRGQTEEAWGNALSAAPANAEAVGHYREAAAVYAAVAAAAPAPAERAAWLRRSVALYRQAREYPSALQALERYLQAEPSEELRNAAYFDRAELYDLLHDPDSAEQSFLKCIEHPSAVTYKARFRLAQLQVMRKNFEDAETSLTQCLALLRGEPRLDQDPIWVQVLYLLADVYYETKAYKSATSRYAEALQRGPDDRLARRARLRLAESYRHLAEAELAEAKLMAAVNSSFKGPLKTNFRQQCEDLTTQARRELTLLSHEFRKRDGDKELIEPARREWERLDSVKREMDRVLTERR